MVKKKKTKEIKRTSKNVGPALKTRRRKKRGM